MTQTTFVVGTPIKKLGNLKCGAYFRHEGIIFVKMQRMVHEGTSQAANSLRLADGQALHININTEVEMFSKVEMRLQ